MLCYRLAAGSFTCVGVFYSKFGFTYLRRNGFYALEWQGLIRQCCRHATDTYTLIVLRPWTRRGAKYCDQYVCLSVCLSVRGGDAACF